LAVIILETITDACICFWSDIVVLCNTGMNLHALFTNHGFVNMGRILRNEEIGFDLFSGSILIAYCAKDIHKRYSVRPYT